MKRGNDKTWFLRLLGVQVAVLLLLGGITLFVDPYFHYHKPRSFLSHRIYEERYTNDGIARNFEYNAFVTGTSMTQNFKPTEINDLFSVESVKFPFAGAGYQEIAANVQKALATQEVSMVIWGLDYNGLRRDYDWKAYEDYPDYLYDNNPFNDVFYLFNKSIVYHGTLNNILMTLREEESTTLDEYSAWTRETGLEKILRDYPDVPFSYKDEIQPMQEGISKEDRKRVEDTVTKNLIPVIEAAPDTTFYFFYTPYSILYWDSLYVTGETKAQLEAQQIATDLLVKYPNVKLFNFYDNFDLITNLEYYSDKEHYSAEVSSKMLQWMKQEDYLITKETKDDQLQKMNDYYLNYDYASIYQEND